MAKQLTIIILTYNSEHLIFECLNSIYKYNDIGDTLEIVIVDNCSLNIDALFKKIRAEYPSDIVLIKNSDNNGYGSGNNIGVRYAKSPYFIVMNPDVRIIGPIFQVLLEKFDADKNLGLIGVNISNNSKSLYLKPEYCNFFLMIFSGLLIKLKCINLRRLFFSGSFLAFNKQIFIDSGAFDEHIFMFHEEADISNRILSLGKNVCYAPNIKVHHLAHYRKVNDHLMRIGCESRKYYFKKYNTDINRYYRNLLIIYLFKYCIAVALNNKLKMEEFLLWIDFCKRRGEL
ncbi:MAG: glycosyltransferase family 2 protein [Bacteroidales bacterium]|nr:glycosyltransferase family 2 protein [Bacteroidales bacterium]